MNKTYFSSSSSYYNLIFSFRRVRKKLPEDNFNEHQKYQSAFIYFA